MKSGKDNLTFTELGPGDPVPYELLLLADPSKELIDEYLRESAVFVSRKNDTAIGIIVLFPLTKETAEIKNVAVEPALHGQGIGSSLIEYAMKAAAQKQYRNIVIGTANSSIGQLYLYQKLGFEITEIKTDFFIKNYSEPIYENGIQAKHMLMLSRNV